MIKNKDLWEFVQEHKEKTADEFGRWLISQQVLRTSIIHKAITYYNNQIFKEAITEE